MIIALTGKKRSGKDTAGNCLVNNYGFIKYSFAEPIKKVCKIIFLWDERHTEGELKEEVDPRWGISPREAFQTIGTELFRERFPELHEQFKHLIGKDIWVMRFVYWYEEHKDKNIVITDLRFLNESGILRYMSAYIVKIVSPVPDEDNHSSEKEMDMIKVDHIIDNKNYDTEFIKDSISKFYDYFLTRGTH